MMGELKVLLLLLFGFIEVYAKNCGYDSCEPIDPDALNVHIVAHSHDDVGWVKTVDEYYKYDVNAIISTYVEALESNPKRKFIQVESEFFYKWWLLQDENKHQQVRNLVDNGQLEIIGGAWSMNDEAAAHYQSIIDQFTFGLRFIDDALGSCGRPKIGWQIDPFGHSKEMASIFAQFGYDAFYFGRLDFRDKKERMETKTMEMIWQGNPLLGNDSNIFTSVLFNLYQPPRGFCFDVLCGEYISEGNKDKKLKDFTNFVIDQARSYPTNNVLITMGGDFTYRNAERYFTNIDFLMKAMEESDARMPDGTPIKLIYSTPSCYAKSVNQMSKNKEFKLKTDDFFPYANNKHSYWTGYFTSRPTSKRYEREGNNLLQITKQLSTFVEETERSDLFDLQRAMGIMQHHDAITGTEKQYVASDYASIMSKARDMAIAMNGERIITLVNDRENSSKLNYYSCPLSNITSCPISNTKSFLVTLYNPLGKSVSHYVKLPVNSGAFRILDGEGKEIKYQIGAAIRDFSTLYKKIPLSKYELVFLAKDIPALGVLTYHVEKLADTNPDLKEGNEILGTKDLSVTLNKNGELESISKGDLDIKISQKLMYYNSHSGRNTGEDRSSGAYCFQPEGLPQKFDNIKSTIYTGYLFDEVIQNYDGWATQSIRVYKDKKYIEFDWVIGVIDVRDRHGKEVIARFESDLESGEFFFTDANGRQNLKRQRNYRETYPFEAEEPITGNYYPITSHISIQDEKRGTYISLLTDRAQGGSSVASGVLELMLHRKTTRDDSWGVGEPLQETDVYMGGVARGQILLDFGEIKNKNDLGLSKEVLLKPWTFLAQLTDNSFEELQTSMKFNYSGLNNEIPEGVHLLTLEPFGNDEVLIRFESTKESGEEITVDLTDLFKPFKIASIEERTLDGNLKLSEKKRLQWNVGEHLNPKADFVATNPLVYNDTGLNELKINLKPMEIRTFVAYHNNRPIVQIDRNAINREYLYIEDFVEKAKSPRTSSGRSIQTSFGLLFTTIICLVKIYFI